MFSFLSCFLVFNVVYHVFTTLTIYGLEIRTTTIPSLLREALRCGSIALLFLLNIKQWKSYRNKWKRCWLTFGGLLIFSVLISYFWQHKGFSDIFIGIKYGFWWLFILLSAGSIGFFYREKFSAPTLYTVLKRGLITTVICGFLRQGLKLRKPEIFVHIGYELKLDDFHFGEKPPLYYLTGYEGTLRRQGLFAGPNNYGYFLIAFLPSIFLLSGITPLRKGGSDKGAGGFRNTFLFKLKSLTPLQRINISIIALRIIAIILTLSRSAILAGVLILILLNRNYIKAHKKALIRGGVGLIGMIALLSVLKRESTLGHITQKLGTIPHIISHPLGYGLGSSGPAIHHNGTILPENYYFQIMLDTGTVGFIFRAIVIFQILGMHYHIRKTLQQKTLSPELATPYLLFQRLQNGFLALLVIGLLLHVFEDSMVNYLFFVVYGVMLGILSHQTPKKIGLFLPNPKTLQQL